MQVKNFYLTDITHSHVQFRFHLYTRIIGLATGRSCDTRLCFVRVEDCRHFTTVHILGLASSQIRLLPSNSGKSIMSSKDGLRTGWAKIDQAFPRHRCRPLYVGIPKSFCFSFLIYNANYTNMLSQPGGRVLWSTISSASISWVSPVAVNGDRGNAIKPRNYVSRRILKIVDMTHQFSHSPECQKVGSTS